MGFHCGVCSVNFEEWSNIFKDVGINKHNGFRTVPMFVPELWNVHYRTLEGADRTNNYAECMSLRPPII